MLGVSFCNLVRTKKTLCSTCNPQHLQITSRLQSFNNISKMISIPSLPSTLLLVSFLLLSVDGRTPTPWNRRSPLLGQMTSSQPTRSYVTLPQIRGGESSDMNANTDFPIPLSERIREDGEVIPTITGGQILRAGKLDPRAVPIKEVPSVNSTVSGVVVETIITKNDKATRKMLKKHKQIAKTLKVCKYVLVLLTISGRRFCFHFLWNAFFLNRYDCLCKIWDL